MKTCPVCQQALTDNAKFCYYCGASLLDLASETPVPGTEPDVSALSANEVEPIAVPEFDSEPETFAAPESDPIPEPIPEPTPLPEPEPAPEPEPEPDFADVPPSEPQYIPEKPPVEPTLVSERKPDPVIVATDSHSLMTTAGYIFTMLLFHIPVIGLIFMIIWGCGKPKNISRKRFALAFLILRLICYIVVLAAAVFVLICFSGVITSLWEAVKPILFV